MTDRILALDVNTSQTGYVVWDGEELIAYDCIANENLDVTLRNLYTKYRFSLCVLEMFSGFKTMGKTTLEAILFTGEAMAYLKKIRSMFGMELRIERITRTAVLQWHLGSTRVKMNDKRANADLLTQKLLTHKYAHFDLSVLNPSKKRNSDFDKNDNVWAAFALATTVTEQVTPLFYSSEPKKRIKRTEQERIDNQEKFKNREIKKAQKIFKKYGM